MNFRFKFSDKFKLVFRKRAGTQGIKPLVTNVVRPAEIGIVEFMLKSPAIAKRYSRNRKPDTVKMKYNFFGSIQKSV